MRYEGKTVLVTGGTGFIGGRLVERLVLEEGAEARVLVRNWHKAVWGSRVDAELVPGDVTNRASVEEAMRGCSVVFHCASGGNSNGEYWRTNVEGTRNILDMARKTAVERVVYVSSVAVHGPSPPANADETAPFRRSGRAYSDSKIAAEELIWRYYRDYGLPVSVVRPTFVWGPRSSLFTTGPLRAMQQGTFALVDRGAGSCNAVYVDNLVDAILLAGMKREAVGEAFLVTDDLEVTWADFFGCYARMLGVSNLPSLRSDSALVRAESRLMEWSDSWAARLSRNPAPLWHKVLRRSLSILRKRLSQKGMYTQWHLAKFAHRGRINIAKATNLLGYKPTFTLETGMQETEAWARDQLGADISFGDSCRSNSGRSDAPDSRLP